MSFLFLHIVYIFHNNMLNVIILGLIMFLFLVLSEEIVSKFDMIAFVVYPQEKAPGILSK